MKRRLLFVGVILGLAVLTLGIWGAVDSTSIVAVQARKVLARLGIYTEKIPSVEIMSNDYNQPGSWHINKSAHWIGSGRAQVTFDLKSVISRGDHKKDVVLVLDTSGSMVESASSSNGGSKLYYVKKNAKELVDYLLNDTENRVALIRFDSTSEILTEFTNEKEKVLELIENLDTRAATNYNLPLLDVDTVMNGYMKDDNRDVVTLFLTDGYPNEDTPNQVGTFEILKDKYPYMLIQGIQYEMGSTLINEIKQISDNQWIATGDNLHNVLFDAAIAPFHYDKLEITDYIENDLFTLESAESIQVTDGTIEIGEENGLQKITWNLDDFISGGEASLIFNLKLKNEYIETEGFYPTNRSEIITSKLQEHDENTINSELTPVLQNTYTVIYDENLPRNCKTEDIPDEKHFVYQNVTKKNDVLSCPGYLFKGWEIEDDSVEQVNEDTFIMPEKDVIVRATWTRQSLVKSMEGTVYQKTTLYDVLRNEYEQGGEAALYTEPVKDTLDESLATWNVYHFKAKSSSSSATIDIPNKDNVLFAGFCWKMVRTTTTGGVKMIYNGEPDAEGHCGTDRPNHVGYGSRTTQSLSSNYYYGTTYTYDASSKTFTLDGELEQTRWSSTTWESLIGKYTCRNSSSATATCSTIYYVDDYYSATSGYVIPLNGTTHYSQIGASAFNSSSNSPSYVGYMYNKVYSYSSKSFTSNQTMLSSASLSTEYFYADEISYDEATRRYTLTSPSKVTTSSEYTSLKGKYTFRNSTEGYTGSSVYYIADVSGSTMYYISLSSGNNLEYYDTITIFGDDMEEVTDEEGNVTYKLTNPTPVKKSEWYTGYSNLKGKYTCNTDSDTCTSPYYLTSTSSTSYTYINTGNNYKFANTFIYNEETKEYTLDETKEYQSFWDWPSNYNKINNTHYTCWNTTGVCETLSYVYYTSGSTAYYINLTEGTNIDEALVEMLSADDVNKTPSTIKPVVDFWYKNNMTKYTEYLEDTIFCNDRSILSLGGWNPNGGSTSNYYLKFKNNTLNTDLTCTNITDQFSMSNEKAKLAYPVGLMSSSEMNLLNNDNARKTGIYYWLLSPNYFYSILSDYGARGRYVSTSGDLSVIYVSDTDGVRPSVSLKSGTEYSIGDGSMDNPYVVLTD